MRLVRTAVESYERLRRKMIRETETSLLFGLLFPDRVPRIPTIEVGKGGFDRRAAEQYWRERLGLEDSEGTET